MLMLVKSKHNSIEILNDMDISQKEFITILQEKGK